VPNSHSPGLQAGVYLTARPSLNPLMPIEYAFPSPGHPLRHFYTSSDEYFVDVQTIGSEDKDSESGVHIRALSLGRSCARVLVGVILNPCNQPHPASESSGSVRVDTP